MLSVIARSAYINYKFLLLIAVDWSSDAHKKAYPEMATELDQATSPNQGIVPYCVSALVRLDIQYQALPIDKIDYRFQSIDNWSLIDGSLIELDNR